MGTNNLAAIIDGITGIADQLNQYRESLIGLFVPRNSSGEPEDEAGGLGNLTYRMGKSYIKDITRNLVAVDTGTVDLSDTNVLKKTVASIANLNLQTTVVQKDSFTFSLDEDSLVNLFFESGLTATASGGALITELFFCTSNAVSGKQASGIYNASGATANTYRLGLSRSKLESMLCNSTIYTETTGTTTYVGGADGGGVRMGATHFFSAGTHTIYLMHYMDDGGVAAGDVDYTNCTYGAMRVV